MPDAAVREPPAPPRAIGAFSLSTRARSGRTVLDQFRQSGAYRILFPRPTTAALEGVLINTAGGVTGGDRFDGRIDIRRNSRLRLTTQAAERAYRARPGEVGRIGIEAHVAPGGRLDWLPQETILFRGCALRRRLRVDLAPGARALLVEPLVFGRRAMGETLGAVMFRDRIEIVRGGAPLYTDAIALIGDAATHLAGRATAQGAGAAASAVLAAPEAEAHLAPLRALLPETGGASLMSDGLLALRLTAPDSHVLRQALVPVLDRLTDDALPRSWTT